MPNNLTYEVTYMKRKPIILQQDPPLFSAVSNSDYALLTNLITTGENINQHRATDGFTPIFIAVSSNDVLMLTFLLENGADPTAKSNAGMTALDLALSSLDFNTKLVKSLLEASCIDSFQEKFNYYELARTGLYNADIVNTLRKYLDISNQNLIKIDKKLDFSDDEWSWSADTPEEQPMFLEQLVLSVSSDNNKQELENYDRNLLQEATLAQQKYYEYNLVPIGDSS
jgi:ankyrin repeat protein